MKVTKCPVCRYDKFKDEHYAEECYGIEKKNCNNYKYDYLSSVRKKLTQKYMVIIFHNGSHIWQKGVIRNE